MHACLLLARLYWSTGRYTESRDWYDKFSNYSSGHAEQDLLFEYDILGAYLKLHDGLLEKAQVHIHRARQSPLAKLALPRLSLWSCEIRLRLAKGEDPCGDGELSNLLSFHEGARDMGCHDEVMVAVVGALSARGRESEGLELARTYLARYRRDGFPPDPRFLELLSGTGFTVSNLTRTI